MTRTIESVFELLRENPRSVFSLYEELAPLYAWLNEHEEEDYAIQIESLDEFAPNGASTVIEAACGPGILLEEIEGSYESTMGFDVSPDMVELARQRCDSRVEEGDVLEWSSELTPQGDVIVLFGEVVSNFDDQEVKQFLENTYANLNDGGVVIFDYLPRDEMVDGFAFTQEFEDEAYQVKQTAILSVMGEGKGDVLEDIRLVVAYDITRKETGEMVRVSDWLPLFGYTFDHLESVMNEVGFIDVTERHNVVIGWK